MSNARINVVKVAKYLAWFIYAVVVVSLVMLTLAFFLRLFGANTDAEFTQWVYRSVSRIMEPFRGIFPNHEFGDSSVLDLSLLFAMILYSIVAIALQALVAWLAVQVQRLQAEHEIAQSEAQAAAAQREAAAAAAASPPTT
ncbi:MAG TPA: YggT family protein [Ilumatobacteraceae bacterium]